MPNYRRSYNGSTYFFTVVTYHRRPILTAEATRNVLHAAWVDVHKRHPFTTDAICLLPEHIHCIWTIPEGDTNYSLRWKEIKRLFTKGYLDRVGPGEDRNPSRQVRGEAALWQRRFWEHTIRDRADFNLHMDTIHYNPVKHGLVQRVCEWPWSSFHRYVEQGYYSRGWGAGEDRLAQLAIGE
jgi:putative transposase